MHFLSLDSSFGSDYTDQIILSPVSNDDVGVYNVKVIVSNPGYLLPVPGNIESIEYELTATLNPCPLQNLQAAPSQIITYQVG